MLNIPASSSGIKNSLNSAEREMESMGTWIKRGGHKEPRKKIIEPQMSPPLRKEICVEK